MSTPHHHMNRVLAALFAICFPLAIALSAKEVVNPAVFDKNGDGLLSEDELRNYLIKRDNVKPDLSVIMTDDLQFKESVQSKEAAQTLIRRNLIDQTSNALAEILEHLANPPYSLRPPFPIAAILKHENLVVAPDGSMKAGKSANENLTIPGLFAEKKLPNGSLGPLLLRKSSDDWSTDPTDAEGAKISYSDDRLAKKTTCTSEGAIIYLISFSKDNTRKHPESSIRSESWETLPSVSWNRVNVGHTQDGDVEELQLKVPVVWSANHVNLGWLRNTEVAFSPYFLTDFGFKGAVVGASLSYTPYIFDNKSGFAVNTGYKGLGDTPFRYRLGLVPSLDYNHLSSSSRFITRDDHANHFRLGGKAEFGIRTSASPSLELLASYQAFTSISGGPNHSDLVSLSAKIWLNDHTGVSLDYKNGSTPIADKDIDLTTFGLELRF